MEVLNILAILLAIAVLIVGIYIIIRGIRSNNNELDNSKSNQKHGLPILARNERQLHHDHQGEDEDALSSMAAAISSAPAMVMDEPVAPATVTTSTQTDSEQMDIGESDDVATTETTFDGLSVPSQQINKSFEQQSPVLDRHLDEQQSFDESTNPLQDYTETFTIVITPQFGASISGRQVLDIARNYGLKHGSMNMFHRHEYEDGRGVRWFSMMAEDKNGPTAFDLNTLADDYFDSLILFLVIPHKQLLRGYDSMVSTAGLLAGDLNAILTDENRMRFDAESFDRLRAIFANH